MAAPPANGATPTIGKSVTVSDLHCWAPVTAPTTRAALAAELRALRHLPGCPQAFGRYLGDVASRWEAGRLTAAEIGGVLRRELAQAPPEHTELVRHLERLLACVNSSVKAL